MHAGTPSVWRAADEPPNLCAGLEQVTKTVQDLLAQAGIAGSIRLSDFVAVIDSQRNNDRNNFVLRFPRWPSGSTLA